MAQETAGQKQSGTVAATAASGDKRKPVSGPPPLPGAKPAAAGPPPVLGSGPKTPAPPPLAPNHQIHAAASAKPATKAKSAPADSAEADSDDDATDASSRRAAKRRAAGPSRGNVAANDDLPSIGGLIFALHQKPSQRPMQVAAVASVVWLLLGVVLGYAMLSSELQRVPSFMELLSRPTAMVLAATILIPIALFWLLAMLVWRAQELKLMSSAMTEVAIRLAEPDRMAEQQIASVGQAVRRQVNHMNDAIGRALGRANELESLVQSEVANLERSYNQNEHRIRALLQELSGERHALLGTSERVNLSLKEMGTEIPILMERLSEQQVRLARFIEEAGRNVIALEDTINASATHLATTVGTRTQELQTVLTDRTGELQAVLTDRSAEMQAFLTDQSGALQTSFTENADRLQAMLEQRTEHFQDVIGERTDTIQTVFDTFAEGLDSALSTRTEGLQTVLEEYTRALDTTLQSRQQSLDSQLIERTKALDDAFSERLKLFDDSILRSTIAIDSMVADKARALSSALESHAKEVGQVLGRQASHLDEQLMHGVNAVRLSSQNVTKQSLKAIEGLAGQADLLRNVSENLVNQISGVTGRFDQQSQTIMRAANALETVNHRIDKTLQNRQTDLTQTLEQLTGKTDEIDRKLIGYSSQLEGTFKQAEERARSVSEQMTRSAEERARLAMQEFERLQSHGAGDTERALSDMRSQFSNVTREVSEEIGGLSSRFSASSEEMRRRAQMTLAEIEAEQTRVTSRFSDSSDEMRRRAQMTLAEMETEQARLSSRFFDTSEEMRRRSQSTLAEIEAEQLRLQAQLERLPEATRNSAETMRASLQEQLKALEQLSNLTSREAVRSDLAAPMPQAIQQQQAAVPRSISSVTQSLAREMEYRAALPAPAAYAQPAPPAPAPQPTYSAPAPAPQPHQAAIAAAEALRGNAGSENWRLGELLARASIEEQQPAAAPRSSLNIAQMARALDATTASAIWSRFRAGQRGVMVRSIYTNDGRAAFDEVHHRYKAEESFRQTVEGYLQDFEQLLRDADQRDATGRTAQTYIVSDSGRVYLFLAHASGRLA